MRRTARLGALGEALGTALAAGALASAADPTPKADKQETPSWLDRLTPGPGKKGDGKTFGDTPARPPVAIAPLEPAALAAALRAEQDAWDRRLEVCYKLRVIGGETGDEAHPPPGQRTRSSRRPPSTTAAPPASASSRSCAARRSRSTPPRRPRPACSRR